MTGVAGEPGVLRWAPVGRHPSPGCKSMFMETCGWTKGGGGAAAGRERRRPRPQTLRVPRAQSENHPTTLPSNSFPNKFCNQETQTKEEDQNIANHYLRTCLLMSVYLKPPNQYSGCFCDYWQTSSEPWKMGHPTTSFPAALPPCLPPHTSVPHCSHLGAFSRWFCCLKENAGLKCYLVSSAQEGWAGPHGENTSVR